MKIMKLVNGLEINFDIVEYGSEVLYLIPWFKSRWAHKYKKYK